MRRSLNLTNLDYWFIVNIQVLDKPKVYKKRFKTELEAKVAKDRYLGNVRTAITAGWFLTTAVKVIPLKASVLTRVQLQKSNPHQRARVTHGRALLRKYKDVLKLKGNSSKSSLQNSLVKLLG